MDRNQNNQSLASTTPVTTPDTNAAAMRARAEEAAARIPTAEVIDIRIDPAQAAYGVLAACAQLEQLRTELEATFGDDAKTALDDLEPAALAALDANAAWVADSDVALRPQAEALAVQRDAMRTVADAAIERGIVPEDTISRLTGGNSYEALAADTHALSMWIDDHRARLGEHCKLSPAETEQAKRDATAFGVAVKSRKATGAGRSERAMQRARAFTYLLNVYDVARQQVGYVRWHEGDADQIAPSLYAGRGRRTDTGIDGDVEPNPELPAPAPVIASPAPVAPTPVTPVNPIPPGFPGADPFIRNP